MRLSSPPLVGFAFALSLAPACAFTQPATVPMDAVVRQQHGPERARGLVVFLPGLGDSPMAFQERGFVSGVLAGSAPHDVVLADAHFGYYRERTVLPRLREDVLAAVGAGQYDELWLVGVSMGAFGALLYAMEHPGEVTGVVALSPYMGDGDVADAVREAGGLDQWEPGDLGIISDDHEQVTQDLWAWLKQYTTEHPPEPRIYIGWGADDDLAPPSRLIAAALPLPRSLELPGGHGWEVWIPLWADFSARLFGAPTSPPEGHLAHR